MQVTLKDIAKKAGFSITTVSRALGGYDDVNEITRNRILNIAAEMGYQPNLVARQLRNQRTHTIGLIIPSSLGGSEDDFFSILLKGATQAATRHHYDVLISAQLDEDDEMDAYRRIIGGQRVDGVIVARTKRNDPRIGYLQAIDHPFVVSGRAAPDEVTEFAYIDVDSQHSITLIVAHMLDYGHQHIGLILPPENIAFTPYRLMGYQTALAAAGIAYRPEYVTHGDLRRGGGQAATKTLLQHNSEITAIVACNDLMALGAMQAVQARGLQVGVDIAIGGFDDIPLAAHTTPTLTTVRQPIYQIGVALTEKLVKLIENKPLDSHGTMLESELIIRESSGYPRQ